MKIQIPLRYLIVLFMVACNGTTKDEVKTFIPGTYTRISEHEFGKEYDTLFISEIGGQFKIQRKNFLTVLNKYLMYSAIPSLAMAFQASSISIILRMPFSFRILEIKTSMIMIVTTGNRIG